MFSQRLIHDFRTLNWNTMRSARDFDIFGTGYAFCEGLTAAGREDQIVLRAQDECRNTAQFF